MSVQTDKQILKKIQSGAYRDCYLVYTRKSTDEANNQKNSIAYQRTENAKLAKREHLPIAPVTLKGFAVSGVISERHSGFKEDTNVTVTKDGMVQYRIERPKFQRLVAFLSQGYFKGVICLCWDRISRNKGDDTVISKLMRSGIDVRFAYATYENSSAGALHMDIDGMFAAHHSRVTSEKVRLATYNLRERGVCTYRAPIGYLNRGDMLKKPFDPDRAPLIRRLFELYAEGTWALAELAAWAGEAGLTALPMRRKRTEEEMLADDEVTLKKVARPLTTSHIQKILRNPFYTGRVIGNHGQYVRSVSHEALVSDKLFDQVQGMLGGRNVSIRYANKIEMPLRGKIRCAYCSRVYTPYMKKGIQYFGARCAKDCVNTKRSFNLSFIEDRIGECIAKLVFTEEELEELNRKADTDVAVLEERRHSELDQMERRKKRIRSDLKYMHENRLSLLKAGVYDPDSFVREEVRLNAQLADLRQNEQISDEAMHETMKDVVRLSELVNRAKLYYFSAESIEKQMVIDLMFSELTLSENTLKFKCKNGFRALENHSVALGDPTDWLSELDEGEVLVSIERLRSAIRS
ncbi:recombinase family protein [Kordiimonas aestuarii]|uniref:recombinase family protein n=1 Tax=Kordiimonas aestuarii TaxID=1005925 RepID=UPI0021D23F83|nr:recombinase family protein [Kordiimonas aestuarii]